MFWTLLARRTLRTTEWIRAIMPGLMWMRLASSPSVTSRAYWARFPMPECLRMAQPKSLAPWRTRQGWKEADLLVRGTHARAGTLAVGRAHRPGDAAEQRLPRRVQKARRAEPFDLAVLLAAMEASFHRP